MSADADQTSLVGVERTRPHARQAPGAGGRSPLELFLDQLSAYTGPARPRGGYFSAKCPAHEDRNPSLSISEGEDSRVLVKCHAGCSAEDVAGALGLTMRDLFPEPEPEQAAPLRVVERSERPKRQTKTEYPYHDEHGELLYVVERIENPKGKTFTVKTPLGDGGWTSGLNGRRKVPYRLPQLVAGIAAGSPVFVVEGEKAADAVAGTGLVVTTNPFGAGKWDASWAPLFSGARVFVLPDHDPEGAEHARDVAGSLASAAERVTIVELPGLPHHGDVADWLEAGHSRADLLQLAEQQEQRQRERPPQGVTVIGGQRQTTFPWPEMAEEGFHSTAGEWARYLDSAQVTEADPVAVLVQVLAGFAAMVGPGAHHAHGPERMPAKTNVLVVGESARARKGTSWGAARDLLAAADTDFYTERTTNGLGSGEGVVELVADQGDGGELAVIEPDRRLLVHEAEFSKLLNVIERQGNTLSGVVRDLYDCVPVSVVTRQNKLRASHHHVVIIGHITATELRQQLTDVMVGNGFANRFLLVATRRARSLSRPREIDGRTRLDFARRVREAAGEAQERGRVHLSEDAWQAWDRIYPELEERRLPPMALALTSRAAANCLRLGLIHALLEGSRQVEAHHLHSARAIVDYSVNSALHFFGDNLGDERADRMLAAARDAGAAGLSGKDRASLFGRNVPADQLNAAVKMLLELQLAVLLRVPSKGGRPAEILVAAEHADEAARFYGQS